MNIVKFRQIYLKKLNVLFKWLTCKCSDLHIHAKYICTKTNFCYGKNLSPSDL